MSVPSEPNDVVKEFMSLRSDAVYRRLSDKPHMLGAEMREARLQAIEDLELACLRARRQIERREERKP